MTGELGLVLSGGGAPAAYFGVGVAQAVSEAGLRPTLYSGVSAGALNAAALSTGMHPKELADVWRRTTNSKVYTPRLDVWNLFDLPGVIRRPTHVLDMLLGGVSWTWLLSTAPARRLLAEILDGDLVTVAEQNILVVSAVDQASAEVVRFVSRLPPAHRLKSADVRKTPEFTEVAMTVDHLLASAAAPLLFPSGKFKDMPGREFIDAGLVANTPLKPALAYEPEAVVIVSASGVKRPAPSPASLGAAIGLLAENVAHFATLADYKHAQTVNALVDAAPEKSPERKHIDLLLVEPHEFAFSAPAFLRFNQVDAERVIELGRKRGQEAVAAWPAADRFR